MTDFKISLLSLQKFLRTLDKNQSVKEPVSNFLKLNTKFFQQTLPCKMKNSPFTYNTELLQVKTVFYFPDRDDQRIKKYDIV